MPYYYHGPVALKGRKPTGGILRKTRDKRKRELGRYPAFTVVGPQLVKVRRVMGGNRKLGLLRCDKVNLAVGNGEVKSVRILDVVKNPSDVKLSRRKIITKGTIIKTELGLAVVTSRPGQDGTLNAVLMKEE